MAVAAAAAPAAVPALSAQTMRIQFLWRAYEPQFWYWEVCETGRRILLTAVLSVVSPGSSEQNLLAILLSLTFIKLYSYYRPYLLDRNDVLAEMGQIQVFFTFLCAMTINNNLLSSKYSEAMDSLLVMTNFSVMFILIFNSVSTYIEKLGGNDISSFMWLIPLSQTASTGTPDNVSVTNTQTTANNPTATSSPIKRASAAGNKSSNSGDDRGHDIELATFKSSSKK
jgi:hypothetical protein